MQVWILWLSGGNDGQNGPKESIRRRFSNGVRQGSHAQSGDSFRRRFWSEQFLISCQIFFRLYAVTKLSIMSRRKACTISSTYGCPGKVVHGYRLQSTGDGGYPRYPQGDDRRIEGCWRSRVAQQENGCLRSFGSGKEIGHACAGSQSSTALWRRHGLHITLFQSCISW